MLLVGFETEQNLSSDFVEWSCAAVTNQQYDYMHIGQVSGIKHETLYTFLSLFMWKNRMGHFMHELDTNKCILNFSPDKCLTQIH